MILPNLGELIALLAVAFIWLFLLLNFKKLTKKIFLYIFIINYFYINVVYKKKKVPFNGRYFFNFHCLFLTFVNNIRYFWKDKKTYIGFLIFFNLVSLKNYFLDSRHHTLNVDKIFKNSPKSNALSQFGFI